jgi:polysaccharide export outer membrane protein
VAAPGRLPITGNETVLDAINYAGGLAPMASVPNIRLVRPAPPGTCEPQVLPINLAAIIQEGDTTTNYQLMPGDRIFVYRDPIVRTTIFIDRLAAPFNTVISSILQYSFMGRYLQFLNAGNGAGGLGGIGGGTTSSAPTGRSFATVPLNTPAR